MVSAGSFGERWVAMTTRVRRRGRRAPVRLGRDARRGRPARAAARAEAKAVWLVHSETSTGVVADVHALAAAAKEAGALVVVDAVSSLGAVPCETDAWGLDVVVCRLAEGAHVPAGPRARRRIRSRASRDRLLAALLLRLGADAQGAGRPRRAGHASVSLVRGLDVALELLLEEGLEASFDRHVRLGRAARAGVKALGLELFSPDEDRSAVVTAVRAPAGVDSGDVIRGLRDRFGITIANGQGELKGKIFRLGHIGWFDVFDITTQIGAVELVLADLGVDVERGVAVTAALEAFSSEPSRA